MWVASLSPVNFIRVYLAFLILTSVPTGLNAQNAPIADSTLWPLVEQHLDQQPADTSFQFILPLVRTHCGNDADCLLRSYKDIMYKLEEQRFNLLAAIFIAEEIRKIAHQHNAIQAEAAVYRDLGRYYDALGEPQKAIVNLDKALELYQKIGDRLLVTKIKMVKMTMAQKQMGFDILLPEMNALLEQVVAAGDTQSVRYIHLQLIEVTMEGGLYDEAAQHIAYIEKIPVANPPLSHRIRHTHGSQ